MLDSGIGWGLEPLSPWESQELLWQVLWTLSGVSWIVKELCYMFVGHDIPDAIWRQNNPLWYHTTLELVVLWIICKGWDLRFCDDSRFLGENVTQWATHGQAWVRLIEDPDSGRSKLLTGLGWSNRARTLNSLNDQGLIVSVINLALIVIDDTVNFVWQVRLVISCLGHNHDLNVLGSISSTLMHVIRLDALTNNDSARVSCISKIYCVLLLINSNECTSR